MITLENGNEKDLFVINCDGQKQTVPWEELHKYWPSGERHQIGGVGAFVQAPVVICWLTYSTGAKGVVFIWDTRTQKIIHVSEGSYVRKALALGSVVFTLRELPKPDINDLVLCVSPINNMDGDSKPKVTMLPLNIKIFDKKFNIENYKLGVKDGCVFAGFRNEVRKIKINVKKPGETNDDAEAPKPTIQS